MDDQRVDVGAAPQGMGRVLAAPPSILHASGDRLEPPLFLDEAPDAPRGGRKALLDHSTLFLDEDDPAVWSGGHPALSPTTDASGDRRFAPSSWSQIRATAVLITQPLLVKALVVAAATLAFAGATAYRVRDGSALALWRSLGF